MGGGGMTRDRTSQTVEIECRIAKDDEKQNAIAIIDGSTEEIVNKNTGEITERPKWTWIPRSQITKIEASPDGKTSTVTMSEWIAGKVGLI